MSARRGWTLIELLVVMGVIAVIAGVVSTAIAPRKIFLETYDAKRKQERKQLEQAMVQHLVAQWEILNAAEIPEGEHNAVDICTQGVTEEFDCVNLDALLPDYIAVLPIDPAEPCPEIFTGYRIYQAGGRPHVLAVHLGLLPREKAEVSGCQRTRRVSVTSHGTESSGSSVIEEPVISGNGRTIAFHSTAPNLVLHDTNDAMDIYVHDQRTRATIRASVASGGGEGNGHSTLPALSTDGRIVAFQSTASNLVAGDTNGWEDIFVHDLTTQQTTRVSIASDGSQGNGDSTHVSMSADGRVIAFDSRASTLVAGDTNEQWDVFVHDRQTGATTRVSVASDGTEGNGASHYSVVSADGRSIVFHSSASNLVPGDTNGTWDIFVHDRETQQTQRVSIASDGSQANGGSDHPVMSSDGQIIAFHSDANNLVTGDTNGKFDIFVRDRETGQTSRVSVASDGTEGNGDTHDPLSLSADGRFVGFASDASNLAAGDTNGFMDIFMHDRQMNETKRMSVAGSGLESNGLSRSHALSSDGRYVVFGSFATNIVQSDTNGQEDVFTRRR